MTLDLAIMIGLKQYQVTGQNFPPVMLLGSFSNDDFSMEWF